jgi:hypothetical protein
MRSKDSVRNIFPRTLRGTKNSNQGSCRGEFGYRVEDAADQHGQGEVAAAIAVGAEDALEADLAGDADRR